MIRAVAVSITLAVAFGLHLPNADWMPIAALAAMKSSLQQSTLAAEQRLAGAIIGAAVAPYSFLLTVDSKIALEVVIVILGALAGCIYAANYAFYCAAVAAAVLIDIGLPHPSNLADEGRRVLFTVADARLARAPAARSRVQAMAAQVSHAALAANESTYGRWASDPSVTSAGRSQDVVMRIHSICMMRADLAGAIIGGSAAAGTERR